MNHTSYLELACSLARSVQGQTAPNPPVGAVVVRGGRILGSGVHFGPGQPHAEAAALDQVRLRGESAAGATIYVSLEPCCHQGPGKRTPPCTQRIIAEGLTAVHIGCLDPNPAVSGNGVRLLREAGLTVTLAEDQTEALDLIHEFRVWIQDQRATFHLKWAQSLDGQVAAFDGSSRWITGPESRQAAHRLRSSHDAVLIGAGTLRQDDPSLLVREVAGRQPVRLILAGQAALPMTSQVFQDGFKQLTWVVAEPQSPAWTQAQTLVPDRVIDWQPDDWAGLSRSLFQRGLYSVLVEGGAKVHNSLLRVGLWDRLSVFVAPKLLGNGKHLPGDLGRTSIGQALDLPPLSIKTHGLDFLLTASREVKACSPV